MSVPSVGDQILEEELVMEKLTLDEALVEWRNKDRSKIGCVQAANWFCRRVKGLKPIRFTRASGNTLWEHVMVTDGHILLDPSPWNDAPDPGPLFGWEKFEGKED